MLNFTFSILSENKCTSCCIFFRTYRATHCSLLVIMSHSLCKFVYISLCVCVCALPFVLRVYLAWQYWQIKFKMRFVCQKGRHVNYLPLYCFIAFQFRFNTFPVHYFPFRMMRRAPHLQLLYDSIWHTTTLFIYVQLAPTGN